jgi:hypothetical protein
MSAQLPSELTIKITLRDSEPPIWRRVAVTDDINLERLHDIIQVSMGWFDCHLHEFHIGDRIYGVPDPVFEDPGYRVFKESGRKLRSLVERDIRRFDYVYDFGDHWVHDVVIACVNPIDSDRQYPCFIDGKNPCPPEDVGGMGGFYHFLEAIRDPDHEEHDEMTEWADGYDPDTLDVERIKIGLEMIAERSRAPWRRKAG